MKTTNDQTSIVYQLLQIGVKAVISGDIYKDVRPSSSKEDVVVSSVSLVGQGYQRGTVNVNIWVLDLRVGNQYVPNTKRLDEIAKIVNALILGSNYDDFTLTLKNQTLQEQTDIFYHFYSISIDTEFFNS